MKHPNSKNKLLIFIIVLLLVPSTILWLSSYTHHTGVGVDHDFEKDGEVTHTIYRLSWTGHGSIWVGYSNIEKKTKTLEKFDPAAVFFKPTNKPLPASASQWNRAGFWYINSGAPKNALWIGIPSWLPVLALLLLLYLSVRGRKTSSF